MATEFSGVWAVITSEGKSYIGKVVATQAPLGKGGFSKNAEADIVAADVLVAERVTLNPVFDFFSPLRPVQGPRGEVGFSRDPIVTPFEFTMEDCPVHVRVGTVTFFDEMTENDRRMYQGMVQAADEQKMAARMQRSGLSLPEGSTRKR
jgi:hypothetical protein